MLLLSRTITSSDDPSEADIGKTLQAWMPSAHVWSKRVPEASPQFLNHVPPRLQQLGVPDFLLVPHLAHLLLRVAADRRVSTGSFAVTINWPITVRIFVWEPIRDHILFSRVLCEGKLAFESSTKNRQRCSTKYVAMNISSEYRMWQTGRQPVTIARDLLIQVHNFKSTLSTTYFRKTRHPRPMYARTVCPQHLHSSWTKHHLERNSWVCRISL